ncbi:MAG: hypothetical protein IPJ30_27405 [Acidobacteria bacterium]|nr:hypothetical protein [Acidobacteriota bacterium]
MKGVNERIAREKAIFPPNIRPTAFLFYRTRAGNPKTKPRVVPTRASTAPVARAVFFRLHLLMVFSAEILHIYFENDAKSPVPALECVRSIVARHYLSFIDWGVYRSRLPLDRIAQLFLFNQSVGARRSLPGGFVGCIISILNS